MSCCSPAMDQLPSQFSATELSSRLGGGRVDECRDEIANLRPQPQNMPHSPMTVPRGPWTTGRPPFRETCGTSKSGTLAREVRLKTEQHGAETNAPGVAINRHRLSR